MINNEKETVLSEARSVIMALKGDLEMLQELWQKAQAGDEEKLKELARELNSISGHSYTDACFVPDEW